VMAVFLIAQDALEAALEMLAEIELLNQRYPDQPSLHLKLGIHQGPCIAVNANDILDYFGSTVNLAARAQGESRGDDFVLTQALMDEPAVRARLEREGLQPEVFTVTPKGFSEPVTLYRFVVPERQTRTLASAG
jgi:adenylate cyclase